MPDLAVTNGGHRPQTGGIHAAHADNDHGRRRAVAVPPASSSLAYVNATTNRVQIYRVRKVRLTA